MPSKQSDVISKRSEKKLSKNRSTKDSSSSSDKLKNGDSDKHSDNERKKDNLFVHGYTSDSGTWDQVHSDVSHRGGLELVKDAYNKAADKGVLGPARETLKRFDQEVNKLVKQSEAIDTKASTIEPLDNLIESVAQLKTAWNEYKNKLLHTDASPDNGGSEQTRQQHDQASSSSSDVIRSVYSREMADKGVFGPAREALERFDQVVNKLVKQSEGIETKASAGEGETLDNLIKSVAEFKTGWHQYKEKLLHTDLPPGNSEALKNYSDTIRSAYSKEMADDAAFGPAKKELERFDQEVKELLNQSREIQTKASGFELLERERIGEGKTLDGLIKFAAQLKTEWNGYKEKLLGMRWRLYSASEQFFSISAPIEEYHRVQSMLNELGDHPVKQEIVQYFGGQGNLWRHIDQSEIKLQEKVKSQIETINAALEKTEEALQKATNDQPRLEDQRVYSLAACGALYRRLMARKTMLKDKQATFDAAKTAFEQLDYEVKELVMQDAALHRNADWYRSDGFQRLALVARYPFVYRITVIKPLKIGFENLLKELRETQESIISNKEKLPHMKFLVEDIDRLQPIIDKIDVEHYNQKSLQDIMEDVHKGNKICQENDQSRDNLIKQAELQIKKINAIIEKVQGKWQMLANDLSQLEEGQVAYKMLQQRLAEGRKKLRKSQATFNVAKAPFERFAYEVKELENQGKEARQRAHQLGSGLLKGDTTGKGEPLGNQIDSAAKLKSELEGYLKKLQEKRSSIIKARDKIPAIQLPKEDFDELELMLNKINIETGKEGIEQDFRAYKGLYLQNDLTLRKQANEQIETINASIQETMQELQRARDEAGGNRT